MAGSAPAPARTVVAQSSLMWLWFGVVIIALAAGGYFSYRWLHRKAEQTPSTAQTNRSGNAPIVGSSAPKASGRKTSVPSTTPGQSSGSAEVASGSAAGTLFADIRKVDFRNFEYHSDPLRETVRVTKGQWWGPKNGNPSGDHFGVAEVRYGDIEGNGAEDAVVWTESAFGGMSPNARQAEIFVFSPSATGPRLLEGLWSSDVGEGDAVDWGRLTDVRIIGRELAISYSEAQCNACNPDWSVLVSLSWNGSRFVRTGLIRKPYAQSQGVVSGGTPEPSIAPQPQPKPKSARQGTWGFQSPSGTGATGTNTAGNGTVSTSPPPVQPAPPPPPAPTRPPQPASVQVPVGTAVEVQTIDPIDSGVNHTGDILRASLATPIIVGSHVVIPQGADVYLRMLEAHSYQRNGRVSEVRLVLDHVVYRGQSDRLFGSSFDVFGSPRGGQNTETTNGISRGTQVHIAPGAEITFQLTQPVDIRLSAP